MTERRRARARRRPEDRREELLAAGLRVFLDRGLAHATVEDVTRAAGVAKGTFYLYFRTKDALLVALRERLARELAAAARDAISSAPTDDPAAQAEALVSGAISFAAARREELAVVFHHGPRADGGGEALAASERDVLALLTVLVARAAQLGTTTTPADPPMTAALLFHAVHGALVELAHEGRPRDLRRLDAAARALVRAALGRSPASPASLQGPRPRPRPPR